MTHIGLVLLALGQFAAAALPQVLGLGQSFAARAETGGIPAELPLGLFFAIIWNVIFVLYLIHAIRAAYQGRFLDDCLAGPLTAAGALNIVWMLSAQFIASLWIDFFLLFPVMAAAWIASYRLDKLGGFDGTFAHGVACALTGLLSGWVSTAVTISVPDVVRELLGHHATDYVWPYLWLTLVIVGLIAYAFARWVSRSLWYFVSLGWGLAGITANNLLRLDLPLIAYVVAAFGICLVWARFARGARGASA